ncbi:unnamed protein product [Calicophoron daubneyi]|uniref:DUF4550 domain-containing protein n=1 Tax=Calicophoron daubneyi TaxID=300641 RepID=A0AAV2T7Z1_CALDB
MSRTRRSVSSSPLSEFPVILRSTSAFEAGHNCLANGISDDRIVTFNFTFALSLPCRTFLKQEEDDKSMSDKRTHSDDSSTRAGTYPNPVYFHFEYSPFNSESFLLCTDMVVFSTSMAKVYPTDGSSLSIQLYSDGEKLWTVWSEHVQLSCTDVQVKEILKVGEAGGIRIKCWDRREKCALQTKFDRPVPYIATSSLNLRIKTAVEELLLNSPALTGDSDLGDGINEFPLYSRLNSFEDNMRGRTFSEACRLKAPEQDVYERKVHCGFDQSNMERLSQSTVEHKLEVPTTFDSLLRCVQVYGRKPSVVISCPIEPLTKSVLTTEEISYTDFLVSLQLNEPLLSPNQRQSLKPLIIRIGDLNNLPVAPFPDYKAMREKYKPLKVSWRFGDCPGHVSRSYAHQKNIQMEEIQVILTGVYSNGRLKEMLLSTPLIIDLYDRIEKNIPQTEDKSSQPGGLFGTGFNDLNLGQVQPTLENLPVLKSEETIPDEFTADESPCGRIVLFLDEILQLDQNLMHYTCPVLPLSESDLEFSTALRAVSGNPRRRKRDYIGYLENDCKVSVSVELCAHFINLSEHTALTLSSIPKIERVIYITEKEDEGTDEHFTESKQGYGHPVAVIKEFIVKTNASCLGLQFNSATCAAEKLLNKHQLQEFSSPTSRSSCHENEGSGCKLITGFHVSDVTFDLLIMETGDEDVAVALRRLFDGTMKNQKKTNKNSRMIVNSDFKFTERLYLNQQWSWPEIALPVPLTSLLAQPLFHVRDLLPRLAYCAATKIQSMYRSRLSMNDITKCNLLPTSMMVSALAHEFTVPPIILSSLSRLSSRSGTKQQFPSSVSAANKVVGKRGGIFDHTKSLKRRQSRKNCKKRHAAMAVPGRKAVRIPLFHYDASGSTEIYNYSCQKLNSACLAKRELAERILCSQCTYAYSGKFLHSGGFEVSASPMNSPSVLHKNQYLIGWKSSGSPKVIRECKRKNACRPHMMRRKLESQHQ